MTTAKFSYYTGGIKEFKDPNDQTTTYSYSEPLDRLSGVTHPIQPRIIKRT